MGNYKFYTPPMLAECLMRLLPKRDYQNIIDICCGSWNLLEAARKQFGTACYIGVDVDAEAGVNCFKGATFFCEDGRKFATKEKKKYDLVLSNPPFGYLKEEERMFKDAKVGNIKELNNKRYENEMMQANLLLADKDGVLLFILPATFFEGDSYLSIRKSLCKSYTINSIVKLPIETFGSSKISTYALIMSNSGKQKQRASLKEVICDNDVWRVKHRKYVSIERLREGAWINKSKNRNVQKNVEMFRGNISSAQMSVAGKKVLHSSSIMVNGEWYPSIRYCDNQEKLKKAKVVKPGDVIVNRVGRFANYWCISKEEAIVSDCLIVIRASEPSDVYDNLSKNSTNGRLNISTKGVTTKYITSKDILELL